jgi:DNA-binding NarL/FixJ family response regulator
MTSQNLRELIEGDALTDREIDLLYGIALGETHKESGERMFLSPDTIKDYRKRIIAKLGAKGMCNAVALAIGNGIIDISRIVEDADSL